MKTARQTTRLYPSPSRLSDQARAAIAQALETRLFDGVDLHSQIKVAHWNIKGPHFAALHPLFETFAIALAGFNDEIAERAVTLGGLARATARNAAHQSRVPELPLDVVRDLELVGLLSERIELYLEGLREAREVAEEHGDDESVDLLTTVIETFEKHGWFLRATLG